MRGAALGLLAVLAAGPAASAPDRPIHVASFRRADHFIAIPMLEAWEGFLRAEKTEVVGAENVRARSNGELCEFAPGGGGFDGPGVSLETAGGTLLLIPPDPERLARFEAFAREPKAYSDRRPPRLRRRGVRLTPRGAGLVVAFPDAELAGETAWSDFVALVYTLQGGKRAVFIPKTRGGLGRVAAAVERLRERYGADLLVLSRGDAFDRSAASGTEPARILERLGVRAVAAGPDELVRLDDLLRYRSEAGPAGVAFLAANLAAAGGGHPLERWHVFDAGGVRVGVVGLAQEGGERMLSAANARRYSVTDPGTAARDAVAALRPRADLVVALTNLTPAQNARLRERVPGLDLIIGDTLPSDPDSELETVTADDPERDPGDAALLVTADAPAVLTHLTVRRRDLREGRYGLSVREERLLLDESYPDLPGYAPFRFEAYGVEAGTAPALLPAARRLNPPSEGRTARLGELDFWRLASSFAADETGSEAAFLPVQPVEVRTTGDFREGVVRSWFITPDRPVTALLPGKSLAALLSEARRLESPDASVPPGGLRLAVGGVGPGDTVHGVPVDGRSVYRVALTERVLAHADQFRMLAPATGTAAGGPLDDLVVGALRRAAGDGWAAERYRPLMAGRPLRESGMWRIDFRDIGVTLSNNKVVSDPALSSVNNARVRGFDEFLVGGVAKVDADYLRRLFRWSSGVQVEYARSRLRPPGQPDVISTPKNRADARTGVAFQVGRFPWGPVARAFGPSLAAEYEGEVERVPLTRRKHKASLLPGMELFDGTLLRSVEMAANLQRDFTPSAPLDQYGVRLRALLSAPAGAGLLNGELTTRYFFLSRHDTSQDLRLEVNAVLKLQVPVFKRMTLAPYVDLFYFKHKVTAIDGYSLMTGLSLGFSRLWKPGYEPL